MSHSAPIHATLDDWIAREAIPFSVDSPETFNVAVDTMIAALGDSVELFGAAGLMIVMGSATALHTFRGESSSAITTAILFGLVTVVAYMRWKVAPIAPPNRA